MTTTAPQIMPKQQQIRKTSLKKLIFFVKLSYSSSLFIGPPGRVKHIKKWFYIQIFTDLSVIYICYEKQRANTS